MEHGGIRPTQRGPLEEHALVPECRAEGVQDVETRIRVLMEQRDIDHASFAHIGKYFQVVEERHDIQIQ